MPTIVTHLSHAPYWNLKWFLKKFVFKDLKTCTCPFLKLHGKYDTQFHIVYAQCEFLNKILINAKIRYVAFGFQKKLFSNPLQLHICINLVPKRSSMQTTPQPNSICRKCENLKFLFNYWENMFGYRVECVQDLFWKLKPMFDH